MNTVKLLTISIPTWNRAKLLDQLLNELCTDLLQYGLENKIQLLVSNNASEDNTELIIKKYLEYPFITYNKNATNIGAKSNVLKSMELAQTPFVMFIGDDDRLSVKKLLAAVDDLEKNPEIGILIDSCRSKSERLNELKNYSPDEFLRHNFYYMGNAGLFITRTDFFTSNLNKYGYDFFNECWPQSQCMILGIESEKHLTISTRNYELPASGFHDDVMVYSSYYLWRTTIYDLLISLIAIKDKIRTETYVAARSNFKYTLKQNFFNILQCGLFVDGSILRNKTVSHMLQNINKFKFYEKIAIIIIVIAFKLPIRFSRITGNFFILITRGKEAIEKKNAFVTAELLKKNRAEKMIRNLEFEK
jgi:glycosyltransferase involved in cell wall biosynthesis